MRDAESDNERTNEHADNKANNTEKYKERARMRQEGTEGDTGDCTRGQIGCGIVSGYIHEVRKIR